MYSIKYIRQNEQAIRQMLINRGVKNISLDDVLACDQKRIQKQQQIEKYQQELNEISSSLSSNQHARSPEKIERAKLLKNEIQSLNGEYKQSQEDLQKLIDLLPNTPASDVPVGQTSEDNPTLKEWSPNPHTTLNTHASHNSNKSYKLHTEMGGKWFDPAGGVRIAGSRYSILKGDLAKLHRALSTWLLSENTKAGYMEIIAPYIMNPEIAYGMGVLPKFHEDLFQLTNGQYLIPTGEAAIVGMFSGQYVNLTESNDNNSSSTNAPYKPLKITTYTPCFRAEAGAAGKNTSNMIRLHQFHKVEIIQIVQPEDSDKAHEDLTNHAESLLEKLELKYRRIVICTGDMGFHSQKTYDLEVWMPGMDKYVEISSCSNTGDFQARRLGITNKVLPHIINGSALPIERTLAAILENYQYNNKVIIPHVLRPYLDLDMHEIEMF